MSVITRRHSRASMGPDTRLPPIVEAPDRSSPTSSKSYKSREYDNPFRRYSRQSSVSSMTSLADSGISLGDSSVTSSKGDKMNTIDLTKSAQIMKNVEMRRRSSQLKIMPNDRKFSFGSVGKRVTTLLKAKRAFTMFKTKPKQSGDETKKSEDDKAFEIDNLPHKPRFASTLSVEAQYAMMKGYEDVVYSNLCTQYPEYRPLLRRNKTPHTGIAISDVKGNLGKEKTSRSSDGKGEYDNSVDGNLGDTLESTDDIGPATTSTPKPEEMTKLSPRDTTNPSPVSMSYSPSIHSPCDILSGSPISRSQNRIKHSKTKVKSLPETQNTEKQLVMTYRYQRAMDILDDIRKHQGLHALSPRVKGNRLHSEPLKDYNSWSYVWSHEFEPKKANKNMTNT